MPTCGNVLRAIRNMSKEITLQRCADDLGMTVPTLQRWTRGQKLHSSEMPKGLESDTIRKVIAQYQKNIFGNDSEKTLYRFLGELEKQGVEVENYRMLYREQGYEKAINEVLYAMTERKIEREVQGIILPEANQKRRITRSVESLGETQEGLRDNPVVAYAGGRPVIAPETLNACGSNGLLEDVTLRIRVPDAHFKVDYYLRHVQNGKNEFLPVGDRIPLNLDYPFQRETAEGDHVVTIPRATRRQGFQFKCYALCAQEHREELITMLQKYFPYDRAIYRSHIIGDPPQYTDTHERAFPLVEASELDARVVWFILPNYAVYVTEDPFLNNYFLI